ncbi:uncharacterized protein [Watersipora subatra]|uniref:uncharacterized protein n=1 Tax=Watersipora subatra TaxID=2589382 RepID=UPI00355BB37C
MTDFQNSEGNDNDLKVHKREVISPIEFGSLPYGNLCEMCQPQKPKAVTCKQGYIRNPYSNRCIRLVSLVTTWDDAKNYCEANGETLATFETLESAFWLINLRKMNSAWRSDSLWVGAKSFGTEWKWTGRFSGPIENLPWGGGQPNSYLKGGECTSKEKYEDDGIVKADVINPITIDNLPYGNICEMCQPQKPKVVECEPDYIRNPYSNRCVRLIQTTKAWNDAKNYCEAKGETLATFETLESAVWLINLRKTNSSKF